MSDPITDPLSDLETLRRDAARGTPLERVAFTEGMLLGVEATRAEQEYHRRRATRHQFWLHGAGTIAGMGVQLDPASVSEAEADPTRLGVVTRVIVNRGLGIDGLGREVLIPEPYCIDLNAWLGTFAQQPAALEQALGPTAAGKRTLFLYLMVRHEPQGRNLTPVVARELGAGTDAVAFGRVLDDFVLSLELDVDQGARDAAWARGLGAFEGAFADGLWESSSATNTVSLPAEEVNRRRRLLLAFAEHLPEVPVENDAEALARAANIPLASLRIGLDVTGGALSLAINATRVTINNLIRPFVRSAMHPMIPDSAT